MSLDWRTGQQMTDEELDDLYSLQEATPKPKELLKEIVFWLVGIFCLLTWWAVVALAWKLWPR